MCSAALVADFALPGQGQANERKSIDLGGLWFQNRGHSSGSFWCIVLCSVGVTCVLLLFQSLLSVWSLSCDLLPSQLLSRPCIMVCFVCCMLLAASLKTSRSFGASLERRHCVGSAAGTALSDSPRRGREIPRHGTPHADVPAQDKRRATGKGRRFEDRDPTIQQSELEEEVSKRCRGT